MSDDDVKQTTQVDDKKLHDLNQKLEEKTKTLTGCFHLFHDSELFNNIFAKTINKIFETNSNFHVKQRTTGKVQFLFSRVFRQY